MTLEHTLVLGHHHDTELVLPICRQAWLSWSWQRLQLPQLLHCTVTAVLAVTRITTAAATRIPAAVTKIPVVSCCRDAGKIHS